MTINTKELIDALSVVAQNHDIKVTVRSSLAASAIVAGTTFVGAFLLGPIGIIAGAAGGGLYSYNKAKGTFKSAAVVIRDEMTYEQQERLCHHIHEAFKDFNAADIAMLIPMLMSNGPFQKVVISKIIEFLTREMQMHIVD